MRWPAMSAVCTDDCRSLRQGKGDLMVAFLVSEIHTDLPIRASCAQNPDTCFHSAGDTIVLKTCPLKTETIALEWLIMLE